MRELPPIAVSTARRLEQRRKDGETFGAVLRRLLEETTEVVSLESVIEDLLDEYDHVASIAVSHPMPEDPDYIRIKVYTADAHEHLDPGQFAGKAPLYATSKTRLGIEDADGDTRHEVPFEVIESVSGPDFESVEVTPVYTADDVIGGEPISLDEGIKRVRAKIGTPYEEIRDDLRARRRSEESDRS